MWTLFTRDSRKPRLALSAIFALGVLYACIVAALTALSNWAEKDLHAFPFKDEDWLRYLLPSSFDPESRPRILLGGPSTVRENLRYERFEEVFPEFVIHQGGISAGTLDDVTASLEYMRKVYGAGGLPAFMILGISPRFIANIPDDRPFSLGIDRYSPHFSARRESSGIALVPKGWFASLLARAKFVASKGPERFRTALLALAYRWISDRTVGDRGSQSSAGGTTGQSGIDRLLQNPAAARLLRSVGLSRVLDHTVLELLAWRISPYKYSLNPPRQYGPEVELQEGVWKDIYMWNPLRDEPTTTARLRKFMEFANACGIEVWVVNLPERDVSRSQFDQANYESYLKLVKRSFGDKRFLDLKDFLRTDEFYDREHSLPAGSLRLTDAVIDEVRAKLLDLRATRATRNRACE